MAAINFPDSPVDGQAHVAGNKTWVYNSTSTKWIPQTIATFIIYDSDGTTPLVTFYGVSSSL